MTPRALAAPASIRFFGLSREAPLEKKYSKRGSMTFTGLLLPILVFLPADTTAPEENPPNAIGPAAIAHSKAGPSVYGGIVFEHALSRWFSLDAMVGLGEGLDWISARVMLDRSDASVRLRPSLGLCLTEGDSTYEHPAGGRRHMFLLPGIGLAVRFWRLSTTIDLGAGIGPSGTGLEGDGFFDLSAGLMYTF